MVEVDCRTARPGGVTLVAVRLDNRVEAPGVDAHRVRLVSRLDGPVWPPRVEGVPAGPWDCASAEAAVEVVVPTGRVGSVGFASPAPPVEPPVAVETVEPADGVEETDDAAPSPEDVLRVLGDPSPPRDAVDVPSVGSTAVPDADSASVSDVGAASGSGSASTSGPDAGSTSGSDDASTSGAAADSHAAANGADRQRGGGP